MGTREHDKPGVPRWGQVPGAQEGHGGSQAETARSPSGESPLMSPVFSPHGVTPGGIMLWGKTQDSRISVCSSQSTGSKTNLLDGKTGEATSRCPQPHIPQELLGEEEEEAAWAWNSGPCSAFTVQLPPTLTPSMGKKLAFVPLPCPPHLD